MSQSDSTPATPAVSPLEPPAPVEQQPARLEAPKPVGKVAPETATELVTVDPKVTPELDAKAKAFVDELGSLDTHSDAFKAKMGAITEMAADDIRAAANVSNRLLEKPVKAVDSGMFSGRTGVSKSLLELRRTVEELDPSDQDFVKGGILSHIPFFGDDVQDYFRKYQSSQSHLNAIIDALLAGQDELRKDNAAIEQEKVELWATMQRLREYAYLAQRLDAGLETQIAGVTDPDRKRALQDDGLFYVRQKLQDLLTQLAVSAQGYMALDMIRRNNLELIKGVDRATTTTVSALRTAVIVSQALNDQKLVLDQIDALNTTTGDMIEATSEMLREQTVEVHEQAAGSSVDIEKLKRAFDNIYEALDEIDTYKTKALDSMKQTVEVLQTELDQANEHISRMQVRETVDPASTPGLVKGELAL